ncbi:ribosomal protein S18 acetylase RimI-like enzyme [Flavobacteriaceae bacterium MAR_2009_75]|nr:ribosomal protein S18 acetylase RimI-like enzyme [Flavobacteriaceae bacterium MAR_2009_75]
MEPRPEIIFKKCSSDEELKQILRLQKENLPSSVTDDEKETEGFVTVHHSFDILKEMNNTCPHIIAVSNKNVIGYALCMHPKFGEEIAVLKPLFDMLETLKPKIENYMAMGQICISKEYRKKGVFRQLYRTMRAEITPEFTSIITEVAIENKKSLAAHYAIGFEDLLTYQSGDITWKTIQLR